MTRDRYAESLFWIQLGTKESSSVTEAAKRVCREGAFSAVAALGQDRVVQPFAQILRKLVQLVAAVDLDRLARRVQRDLAVLALTQMFLQIGAQRNRRILIEHVIELC